MPSNEMREKIELYLNKLLSSFSLSLKIEHFLLSKKCIEIKRFFIFIFAISLQFIIKKCIDETHWNKYYDLILKTYTKNSVRAKGESSSAG